MTISSGNYSNFGRDDILKYLKDDDLLSLAALTAIKANTSSEDDLVQRLAQDRISSLQVQLKLVLSGNLDDVEGLEVDATILDAGRLNTLVSILDPGNPADYKSTAANVTDLASKVTNALGSYGESSVTPLQLLFRVDPSHAVKILTDTKDGQSKALEETLGTIGKLHVRDQEQVMLGVLDSKDLNLAAKLQAMENLDISKFSTSVMQQFGAFVSDTVKHGASSATVFLHASERILVKGFKGVLAQGKPFPEGNCENFEKFVLSLPKKLQTQIREGKVGPLLKEAKISIVKAYIICASYRKTLRFDQIDPGNEFQMSIHNQWSSIRRQHIDQSFDGGTVTPYMLVGQRVSIIKASKAPESKAMSRGVVQVAMSRRSIRKLSDEEIKRRGLKFKVVRTISSETALQLGIEVGTSDPTKGSRKLPPGSVTRQIPADAEALTPVFKAKVLRAPELKPQTKSKPRPVEIDPKGEALNLGVSKGNVSVYLDRTKALRSAAPAGRLCPKFSDSFATSKAMPANFKSEVEILDARTREAKIKDATAVFKRGHIPFTDIPPVVYENNLILMANGDFLHMNVVNFQPGGDQYYLGCYPKGERVLTNFLNAVQERDIKLVVDLSGSSTARYKKYHPSAGVPSVDFDEKTKTCSKASDKEAIRHFQLSKADVSKYKALGFSFLKIDSTKESSKPHFFIRLDLKDWPDHKAAASPKELLKYARRVSSAMDELGIKDPLIHCRAGVGRSGTLATMLHLIRTYPSGSVPDGEILKTVLSGREQRGPSFVQKADQFLQIYQSLEELGS